MKKPTLTLAACASCLLLLSCGCGNSDSSPYGLNDLPRPLTVIANNTNGLALQAADGRLLNYDPLYHIAKIALAQGFKPGEIFGEHRVAADGSPRSLGAGMQDTEIEQITRLHKINSDISMSGIKAGYYACRKGIPLTNYLSDVEAALGLLLKKKITSAMKQ